MIVKNHSPLEILATKHVENHQHISIFDARWFADKQLKLNAKGKSTKDIYWLPSRFKAERIDFEKSRCYRCHQEYVSAYYSSNVLLQNNQQPSVCL